jgi:hypothetical protein
VRPASAIGISGQLKQFPAVLARSRRSFFKKREPEGGSDYQFRQDRDSVLALGGGTAMKSLTNVRILFLLTVWSLVGRSAAAQTDRGSVTGHVSDPSGGVLQGAQIELQPSAITIISNQQGGYFINNLAPGSYTITVTYVGFAAFTKTLTISAGQTAVVDAKMEVSSQKDQIIVTADAASGEAEAVNREKTADNVLQVMTSEVITALPNATIADAVGRLPGVSLERDEGEGKYIQVRSLEPRLTNATIDGVNVPSPEANVREIKFDAMPADLVESVEVNKTLQANMDGDGIGGSVNIVTKTAGERPAGHFWHRWNHPNHGQPQRRVGRRNGGAAFRRG